MTPPPSSGLLLSAGLLLAVSCTPASGDDESDSFGQPVTTTPPTSTSGSSGSSGTSPTTSTTSSGSQDGSSSAGPTFDLGVLPDVNGQPELPLPLYALPDEGAAHVGSYTHEHWGTVTFRREEDGLHARLGQLPLDFKNHGRGRFRVTSGNTLRLECEFVQEGEQVTGLHVWDDEGTDLVFARAP